MSGYINDEDIFVRTEKGSNELSGSQSGIIPRKARTILILIDGLKTYAQVADPLEKRKTYKDGVRQYMQMLVDLELVVCKTTARSEESALSEETAPSDALMSPLYELKPQEELTLTERAENHVVVDLLKQAKPFEQLGKNHKVSCSSSTEALRDIISSLVNKHADADQARAYNKRLSNCYDMRSIFELVQEMQRASVDELELALYLAALAFKKSKVSKPHMDAIAKR